MKNIIFVNLAVLLIIILTSLNANAASLKVNEDLLVNHPESCARNFYCE
jgi:hypothetical protein